VTREQAQKIARSANQEAFAPSIGRRVQVRYRRSVAGDGALCARLGQDVYACVDSHGRYYDLTPRQLRACTYTDRDGTPIAAADLQPSEAHAAGFGTIRPACKFCDGSEPCGWCDKAPLRTE
jgi:hypothetical protein